MALTSADRGLLQRCLNKEPGAWNDFVDRFLGLIYHVIHHTAHLHNHKLSPEDVEDMAAEILLHIVDKDYAILRQFRGKSSLSTYLTVIARRQCLQELSKRAKTRTATAGGQTSNAHAQEGPPKVQIGLDSLEEVQQLMRKLPNKEREVVRLFYLEGRSYEEISTQLQMPVNSIGPILTRARQRMRRNAPKA
ncbi:MAG: RNA polymerase sigma factor [Gemmatales bacterium]|nr:MAG: RNA polymerase sigma factor [Gemmatales bacterium]